ncbi:polyketide synthase [bacterium]|nr:polyketide synthase [bacterium]
MEERAAFIVNSLSEFRDLLNNLIQGKTETEGIYKGNSRTTKEWARFFNSNLEISPLLDKWLIDGRMGQVAELWVKGVRFNWELIYQAKPQHLSLPSYPFAKEQYWHPVLCQSTRKPEKKNICHAPSDTTPAPIGQASQISSNPIQVPISLPTPTTFRKPPTPFQPETEKRALQPVNQICKAGGTAILSPLQSQQSTVTFQDRGMGVYSIRIDEPDDENRLSNQVIDSIQECFKLIQEQADAKVILVFGGDRFFLSGGAEERENLIKRKALSFTVDCPLPVIAAMKGSCLGTGWLLACLCDFMVCSREGLYQYHLQEDTWLPSQEEAALFAERFGEDSKTFLFHSSKPLTGDDLKRIGLGLPTLPADEVEAYAIDLSMTLAKSPQESLVQLKRNLSKGVSEQAQKLQINRTPRTSPPNLPTHGQIPDNPWATIGEGSNIAPTGNLKKIEFPSDVIKVEAYDNGVVLVTLCDKKNKNTFSDAFLKGVAEIFEYIRSNENFKIVVLTGYEQYFCCGGTKDGLIAIQEGSAQFTDLKIFSVALECDLPVIAAMQGHAIGAGWAMGLFCDLVIFSEESVYQAPYMQYGFTPGAGSTLAFPEKLGKDLAWEVLFSAKDFRGSELRDRGVGLKILPRAEVQAYALETAHQLALSSREDLRQSKIERCKHLRLQLKSVLAQELAMHEKTFVGNQTVGKNIQELFGKGTNNDSPESPQDRTSENMDSFASDSTLLTEIRKTLTTTLAEELYMKPEAVLEDLPFLEMGLDSITGVTWIRKINELFGLSTAATKVYSYPTIQALAKHLKDEVEQRGVFQSQQLETPPHSPPVNEGSPSQANKTIPKINIAHTAPTPSDSQEETQQSGIAVIGISGQFPGARTTTEFWENIIQGKDCITEIPPTRWSVDQYFDPNPQVAGKTNSKWMGHLEDADKFDPLFFNISPLEATAMDPQQRLFLEACWGCIEDAGYAPNTLSGSRCGVFAGCAPSDYGQQIDIQKMSAQRFMGGATSILAARISYLLNLHGPSLAIDTACSSSLVAIATGCDSLRTGNSDLVLAGGVCVMAGPGMHVMTSNAGMLSSEGRCFAFDQAANGFVPGEGVGVVMLKRLEDAERDGDSIYGVIRGWGINQDGRTNGITAPSAESQSRLEKDVFKRFNIDPAGIQLMEAHGTGTKLGDPIEIEGLTKAFESVTQKRAYCALGSVKSNIGHLLMAAGVAGLIKVLLAIKHKKLPPTLHINRLNEHIKLEDSPFYLNTTTQEWKVSEGQKRRAAINSFGFSGTNSHMVIEEPPEPIGVESHRNEAFQPPYLVVLSAKNSPCLRKSAENLVTFIQPFCSKETQATESRVCLANISFTLQLGRDPMDERLGLLVESLEDLGEKLSRFLEGDTGIEGLYRGQVRLDRQTVTPQKSDNTAVEDITPNPLQHKGAQILKRWADGESIDWEKLYGKIRPSRINLPSYPFSRESYWAYSGTDQKGNHNEWSPCPLPSDIKWDCRLRNYEGKSITVLYSNDEDKEMILTLLQNMEQAANLRRPIKVSAFNVSQDWLDQSPPKPDVIFYIAPQGTDAERISYPLDFPEKLALCRHNDSEAPLFFYGIINTSDNRSDDTLSSISAQSAKIKGYAWRWIEHNRSSKPVTRIQLLLQEWLSDDRTENSPSNFRITRYEGTNRFAQNDANPAQADKNEDSPWLLEKKWKLEIPSTNEYEPRQSNEGSILILVNNESAKIGQALFRNSSCEKIVIHNDFYTCAQTGRIKAIDTAKELQSNVFLIDLSNLYPTPREEDQDPIGQVTFYQTLIESCEKLNILSVTQGLQHFRSSEMSLAGAKFAGLIKMLSAEYPQVKAKCLDIDQSYFDSPNELSTILNYESKTELRETEICYRDGDRYVPYIDANQPKQTIEKGIGELPPISKKGVYIISGGTNGIGLEIGKHLVSKGARKLVLMGITPLPPREKWELASQAPETRPYIQNKLSELIDLDRQTDRLEIYTGSISDLDNLNLFFDRIRTDVGTIKGVIHSAGIYSDTKTPAFVKKDTEAIAKVWEPKVRGIETLHQLCKNDEPDFFISFSSLTGLIPELARGVSDYAMANAFLDFFSSFQFHQKNKTYYKSITWVDWNDTGHTSRSTQEETERLENKLNALGLRTFSREDGRKLFNKSLTFLERNWVLLSKLEVDSFNKAKPHLLFVKKEPTPARSQPRETRSEDSLHTRLENWEKQKSLGRTLSISTLTQHITLDGIRRLAPSMIHRIYLLLATENSEPHPPSQESQSAKSDLGLAEPQDQHTELVDTVTESLASVLELREVDPNVTFQNYGLDSITAVVLSGRLERLLTLDIPPQWLIKYPTANSLSSHLSTQKRIANKLD